MENGLLLVTPIHKALSRFCANRQCDYIFEDTGTYCRLSILANGMENATRIDTNFLLYESEKLIFLEQLAGELLFKLKKQLFMKRTTAATPEDMAEIIKSIEAGAEIKVDHLRFSPEQYNILMRGIFNTTNYRKHINSSAYAQDIENQFMP